MGFSVALFLGSLVDTPLVELLATSLAAGVTSHLVFFVHGELNRFAQGFFLSLFLVPAALFAALYHYSQGGGVAALDSLLRTAVIWLGFLHGLATSILVYRLWLHPLRRFPGPTAARVSMWWGALKASKGFQSHYMLDGLHKTHGDFVRIGPKEVSINNEAAAPVLARCAKGPWYDLAWPKYGLHATRNPETHRLRRRVWDKAFTKEALAGYVPRMLAHSDELIQAFQKKSPGKVDVTEWFGYYVFDVMGDLSFGRSFGMLRTGGKDNYFMKMTRSSQVMIKTFGYVPYVVRIMALIPWSQKAKKYTKFLGWCREVLEERKKANVEKMDLFSWLIAAEPTNIGPHKVGLDIDVRTAIVAGSDTTSMTLSTLLFYLAKQRKDQQALREELDHLFSFGLSEEEVLTDIGFAGARRAPRLEGAIREALRINPAVPCGVERITPPGGVTIGGTFIPGGTLVRVPLYSISRDERYWERPKEFLPERWYSPPDYPLTHKYSANTFIPFWTGTNSSLSSAGYTLTSGQGVYGCVGKNLAMMNLRIVTTRLLRRFEFELADGMSEERMYKEAQDLFVLYLGGVELLVKEREMR